MLPSLVSMKWPQWNCQGSWGQERPPSRWVQGERSLPRVIERRYVLLALAWGRSPDRATAWGMQRGYAVGPLPRWFCTTKHILRFRLTAAFKALYYNDCCGAPRCATSVLQHHQPGLTMLERRGSTFARSSSISAGSPRSYSSGMPSVMILLSAGRCLYFFLIRSRWCVSIAKIRSALATSSLVNGLGASESVPADNASMPG